MIPSACKERKCPRYKQQDNDDFCIIDIRNGKALFTTCFEVSNKTCKRMRAVIKSVETSGGQK